ncbi:MAG TPA: NfeD family protein [Gallionella sp.]|nr:NfeD family protein [Gallionella sp.]
MSFMSWLVIGVLFMLGEIGTGNFYLLSIGLAFIYPAIAAYFDAPTATQLTALGLGVMAHAMAVLILHQIRPSKSAANASADIGQRVEVIEWLDECSARVSYRDREWQADKVYAEMPDAAYGIIKAVQGNRLTISTAETA